MLLAVAPAATAASAAALTPVQAAVLGVVQGLSEFLPISSSAHLFIVPRVLGWPYHGVAFDVALHWGTLIALLAYFWRDWWTLARDAVAAEPARRAESWSIWARLAAASVPAALAGLALDRYEETLLRRVPLQAALLIVFGLLLWWVDRSRPPGREARVPGWGPCLAMGVAQSLALVPGVSRSGVTITAGRAVGLSRVSAARFSFLLATPVTLGAGLLKLRHLAPDIPATTLAIGVGVSALAGWIAIGGLIRWLGRAGFGLFCGYRVALGLYLLLAFPRG